MSSDSFHGETRKQAEAYGKAEEPHSDKGDDQGKEDESYLPRPGGHEFFLRAPRLPQGLDNRDDSATHQHHPDPEGHEARSKPVFSGVWQASGKKGDRRSQTQDADTAYEVNNAHP